MKKILIFLTILLSCSVFAQNRIVRSGIPTGSPNYIMGTDSVWSRTTQAAFIDTLNAYSNVVNVKTQGATGDGVTNDKTAIDNSITNLLALGGGLLYLPEGTYLYSGQMDVNLASKSMYIYSEGAVVILDDTTSQYTEKDTAGIWYLHDGDILHIQGVQFKATNFGSIPGGTKDSTDFLNALFINDFNEVTFNKIEIDSAIYSGAWIMDVGKLTVVNSKFMFNHYSGMSIHHIGQTTVLGNSFSYNGEVSGSYANGYGFSSSHRRGNAVDNDNVYIAGNKFFYNYRKGIDVHGGKNIVISGNHIKGFLVNGIGAVNESGSDPDDPSTRDTTWYKWVKDVKIINNYIENDSLWLDSLSGIYTDTQTPISIGSAGTHVLAGGSFEVIGNRIKGNNSPISQRSPIFVWINTSGERMDAIKIKDNVIYDVRIDTANFATDGVINVVSGTVVPRFLDISGNEIYGTAYNGIKVNWVNASQAQETIVQINKNDIQGAFTYPYYCSDENIITGGNTYNHLPVENLINQYEGNLNFTFVTAGAADSINIVTWDASVWAADRLVTYDIHIVASNATDKEASNYDFYATVGDDGGTPFFTTALYDSVGFKGFALGSLPTISWTNSDADNGVLKIHASALFTRYSIRIKISSWGIPIWTTN